VRRRDQRDHERASAIALALVMSKIVVSGWAAIVLLRQPGVQPAGPAASQLIFNSVPFVHVL
jgi:hypothetical protein